MGVWVPTDLQAIAVRVDPREALPYMAMVTMEDHHWVWRPTDHHWVWRPTYHHWVWRPTYHLSVWTPTDPRAIVATVGSCSILTQEAGPDRLRVHWAAKISSQTMLFPGVNFTLWRICRVKTNKDLEEETQTSKNS